MNAITSALLTQNDTTLHIQPLILWQCACGGSDLPKRDYQHIIACPECETLATEIGEALQDLEKTLGRHHRQKATS